MTIFETARLRFRETREDDLEDFFRMQSDPESMQYIRPPYKDREVARERMRFMAEYRAAHPLFGSFVLEDRTYGRFAGNCVARHAYFEPGRDLEIGYMIAPEFRGQGLATEVAQGLTDYLFRVVPDLQKVIAFTHPENAASQRVLKKCGYVYTGLVDTPDGESFLFERYP